MGNEPQMVGKTKRIQPFHARFPVDVYEDLAQLASDTGRSMNHILIIMAATATPELIEEGLKKFKAKVRCDYQGRPPYGWHKFD